MGEIKLKYECLSCKGEGKYFLGLSPGFNSNLMEVYPIENYAPCSECDGKGLVDNIDCVDCGNHLTDIEIERGDKNENYICTECDDTCRCRLCEENN